MKNLIIALYFVIAIIIAVSTGVPVYAVAVLSTACLLPCVALVLNVLTEDTYADLQHEEDYWRALDLGAVAQECSLLEIGVEITPELQCFIEKHCKTEHEAKMCVHLDDACYPMYDILSILSGCDLDKKESCWSRWQN